MVKAPDGKTAMTLSLRLLRRGKTVEEALRTDHGLEEVEADGARLFVEQSPAVAPTWFSFVRQFSVTPLARLENKNCGAVLFVEVTTEVANPVRRTMALAFGGAWHALEQNSFERSFGLRVALNSTPRANLRNLDVATLDATTMQKRIQASRKADLGIFGIDVQRDLLRLAGGIPSDYSVVFGIMRSPYRKSGTVGLPFFSKVSLRAVANRIQSMSYTVEVHLIESFDSPQ